jgi:hypothetical protein
MRGAVNADAPATMLAKTMVEESFIEDQVCFKMKICLKEL